MSMISTSKNFQTSVNIAYDIGNVEKAKNFIPKEHEIILYDFPDKSIKIKVGDGKSLVGDLPFLQEEKFSSYIDGEVAYLSDDVTLIN